VRFIRLSVAATDYLRTATYLAPELYQTLRDEIDESPRSIALDDATAEQARNGFAERLAQVGFDDEHDLSGEGDLLEDLIDRFLG
jgi:hypothetical protein